MGGSKELAQRHNKGRILTWLAACLPDLKYDLINESGAMYKFAYLSQVLYWFKMGRSRAML